MTGRFVGIVAGDIVTEGGDRAEVESRTAAEVARRVAASGGAKGGAESGLLGVVAAVVAEIHATVSTEIVPTDGDGQVEQ